MSEPADENQKLTVEDGRTALADHARDRGEEIRALYGPVISMSVLEQIYQDERCVRFPVRVDFDTNGEFLSEGLFAVCEKDPDNPPGYVIYIHPHFQGRDEVLPALICYHLVTVNYGEFAASEDAETFGAAILGLDTEEYYQQLCALADEIG